MDGMKMHTKEELMVMPPEDLVGMIMMMESKHGAACKGEGKCKGGSCKGEGGSCKGNA
jgi:hypothetical protein